MKNVKKMLTLSKAILFVGGVWLAVPASATTANCSAGDAPSPYNNVTSCNSVCTEGAGQWNCDLATLCTSTAGSAYVVQWAANGHDLVAFGQCADTPPTTKFCCTFDEVAAVTAVRLAGTDYDDEPLSFTWATGTLGELNLYPWDADDITGLIKGKAGHDYISGSNYGDPDLVESLYGNGGGDIIYGYAGADFIYGGTQDDEIYAGDGNDVVVGGDGDDHLEGEEGADTLCDTTGESFCASVGGNFMDGGLGNDVLWYNEEPACNNRTLDTNSTAGLGTGDVCGDDNDWLSTELPMSCETPMLTVEPTACIVP